MRALARILVCAIGVLLMASSAQSAQPMPSAYRIFKLCEIQDPQCLVHLRALVRQINQNNPQCAKYPVPDSMLYATFMQVTSRDVTLLGWPPYVVERFVYNATIASCIGGEKDKAALRAMGINPDR